MRIRGIMLRAAMLFYLLSAAPVLAMAEVERREINRPAIVQTIVLRERRRALDRRYGGTIAYKYVGYDSAFHLITS